MPTPPRLDGADATRRRRAKALADPTRSRVFDAVAAAPDGIDVAALTARFGVHHTAVRQHLQLLVAAGLVEESTAAARGRGRPRLLYRATPAGRPPEAPYVDLARLLTRAVRTGRTAREIGRDAGRDAALAAGGEGPGDSVDVIADEARRLGFEPSVAPAIGGDGIDIVLGACPFADVAADDPKTVCALHLGLAEGVAEALGDDRAITLHVADPLTGGCRLMLRNRARKRGGSATGRAGGPGTGR